MEGQPQSRTARVECPELRDVSIPPGNGRGRLYPELAGKALGCVYPVHLLGV